jgi:hypothetical protein
VEAAIFGFPDQPDHQTYPLMLLPITIVTTLELCVLKSFFVMTVTAEEEKEIISE